MRSALLLSLTLAVALAGAPRRGPEGAVLGRAGIRHAGHVTESVFSPQGTLLATCSASRFVRLWRLPGAKPVRKFDVGTEWVLDLAWSPGGDALAVAASDATVSVFDVATGERLYRNRSHLGEAQRVAFLPDGRLASGGRTGLVLLHDIAGGTTTRLRAPEVAAEETGEGPDYSRSITDLLPTHDGEHLVVGDGSGSVHIWELSSKRRLHRLDSIAPGRLSLRPGSNQLVVLRTPPGEEPTNEGSLELLRTPDLQIVARLRQGSGWTLTSTAFTPDGGTLVLGSYGTLEEIPLAGGPGRTSAMPGFHPVRLDFSADGNWLAMGGGPEVRVEHRPTRTITVASDGHLQPLAALHSDRAGRLHSIGAYQEYKAWDLREGLVLRQGEFLAPYRYPDMHEVNDLPSPLARAAPTPGGGLLHFDEYSSLLLRSGDLSVGRGQWYLAGGTCLVAAESADLAIAGTEDGAVQLLRPSRPSAGLRSVRGRHGGRVTAVALAPKGTLALSGGLDTRVRRIDTRARRSVALPEAHVGPIVDLDLSRDGKVGASGAQDRTVVLYDVPRARVLATLGTDGLDLSGWVALAPAGDVLAAGTTNGAVRLYSVPGGEARGELPAGIEAVGPLHVIPGTGELVAATADGSLRRWPKAVWRGLLDGPTAPAPLR